MNLEQQVVSLEYAKRLKELGVKQESYFYWHRSLGTGEWQISGEFYKTGACAMSAYTVAELGEMLPLNEIDCYRASDKENTFYFSLFNREGKTPFLGEADTEANARAAMLCYLLENKLITI